MMPEVSAIIPTHNRANLLRTTLRTVLWQRDVPIEVLVVDDGSVDDTERVVRELNDPRVRLLRHETAQGVSAARNRGASDSRTDWLAFCDDDDLWAPNKLVQQLAAARGSGRAWAYSGAVHVSLGLRILNVKLPPSPDRLVASLPGWSLMPGGSSNVIVRREAFQAVGGWDPSLINLADWDLWARLAREGPPASVHEPLVGYRIHPGNASADTGLILREADVLDGRYGTPLDRGMLHHYLAWVYLRSGRRRPAISHLARAAAGGQVLSVARTLGTVARARMARAVPALAPRKGVLDRAWRTQAERWLAELREADLATA